VIFEDNFDGHADWKGTYAANNDASPAGEPSRRTAAARLCAGRCAAPGRSRPADRGDDGVTPDARTPA